MLGAISSTNKSNEVVKATSNNNIKDNKYIENNNNKNIFSVKDKTSFTNYKKASAPGTTNLFEENKERVNPLASIIGFILAFVSMTGSSVAYNEALYNAFSDNLDKCKKLFDKYGTAVDIDFLGNISAQKEKRYSEEQK
ncbi:MAG: hypothetical protein KatS3mg068_0151 [Candidatus Sericytochromatia bacterium]|nr:MAG: hypothetical protein KatS3mg068_0151 [Candidatus Sericytochromatia bacterium]